MMKLSSLEEVKVNTKVLWFYSILILLMKIKKPIIF